MAQAPKLMSETSQPSFPNLRYFIIELGRQPRSLSEIQNHRRQRTDFDISGQIQRFSRNQIRRGFLTSGHGQMVTLLGQLQTQASRLTRSIVAETYLLDFDFVVCPRCGTSVSPKRGSDETCYLCLQPPTPKLGREELVQEYARLERQIGETEEIIEIHAQNIAQITESIEVGKTDRQRLHEELNYQTASFVSAQAEELRAGAWRRAELMEGLKNLRSYLSLFDKQGDAIIKIKQLQDEIS